MKSVKLFFSINNKSPRGWTQQGKKVLYMFIPEAKPLTLFNIQLFCQKRFPCSNTSLWRLHVLPPPQFLAQQLLVKVLGFTLLCLFNDERKNGYRKKNVLLSCLFLQDCWCNSNFTELIPAGTDCSKIVERQTITNRLNKTWDVHVADFSTNHNHTNILKSD